MNHQNQWWKLKARSFVGSRAHSRVVGYVLGYAKLPNPLSSLIYVIRSTFLSPLTTHPLRE